MKRFFTRLGEIWIIIGITFLLLIFIELFFRIYGSFNPITDPRATADCYQNQEWVNSYYHEFAMCNASHWEPYVYWKRNAFEGEYIQVDGEGHRRTLLKSHPMPEQQTGVNLFFFGGSAMWGTGVRDEYTIPSLAGNELIMQGINPSITNFGESGYVSSQEVISLVQELKKGNIPDVVVFYDGVNDVFSSYQSGQAGIPQNEYNREQEFNALKEKKKSLKIFIRSLETSATYQFLWQRFGSEQTTVPERKIPASGDLAAQTAHAYNENIRLVDALAKKYGFFAYFYWQPTLFDKLYPTEYEKTVLEPAKNIKNFNGEVSRLLFTNELLYGNIHFHNLSNLFTNITGPLFIDWCHTGEEANLIISQRMVQDILPLIDSLKAAKSQVNE